MNQDNEYELLYLARCHDDVALRILINKFLPFILKTYNQLHNSWIGYEYQDALQAGYVGLINAIHYYREDKDMAFHNFVLICINRQMLSNLRRVSRISKVDYFSTLSIDRTLKDSDELYLGDTVLKDENLDPAVLVRVKALLENIYQTLNDSPLDLKVFELRMQGYSYQEVAQALSVSKKTVDNTVQRIRKKVAYLFD